MPNELQATLSNVIPFSFYIAAVAQSEATPIVLGRAGEATATDVPEGVVPWKGHVVGVSAVLEADVSSGSMTAAVRVDGTAIVPALAATLSVVSGNVRRLSTTARKGVHAIAAGSYVGATYVTNTVFAAGSTPSLIVDVFVAIDEDSGSV